jgi:Plant transposon protein
MNGADTLRVVVLQNQQLGVNGLIGSLNCMHIGWKNCPLVWHGQLKRKEKAPTIIFEDYSDYNLWIWHCVFGYAGKLNDINVWDQPPLLTSFIDVIFTEMLVATMR